MIDENAFFREVTLRICGSLDIETAMHACYEYMSRHLPVDRLFLERHEADFSLRVVAEADAKGGRRCDLSVPLTGEARASMEALEHARERGELPPVIIINRPRQEPISARFFEWTKQPMSSYIGVPLLIDGKLVGALSAIAAGDDRYTDDHARLFATLKEPFFVAMSNVLRHEEAVRLKNRLAEENKELRRELRHISGDEIIGADFGLKEVIHQVRQVAPTESPVLITGETGVGKDLIANAIHLASRRCDGPFIPVNCGAIPDSLLDSELFGHEQGAFTGALSRKLGRFERADKGTILLDEIGEMPLHAQVRLLRVLQHREVERVGGTDRIPLDIRVIAATNRDLAQMVAAGRFREDLLFRLHVFPIAVPSLRERACDIPALVQFFVARKTRELKLAHEPELAPGALEQLMAYDWPGNVRELENVIERALILNRVGPLRFDGLNPLRGTGKTTRSRLSWDSRDMSLDQAVAGHLRRVLTMTKGKIHGPGGAAEVLGVNPNTLRYRLSKLGIAFGRERRGSDAG